MLNTLSVALAVFERNRALRVKVKQLESKIREMKDAKMAEHLEAQKKRILSI